ncbi:MAG: hypothetical protein ABSG59_10325 [Verrucomicrobiota bacterium]|jgi:hypothetical protein
MTTLQNLTVAQLRKLVSIKKRIEGLTARIEAITGEESRTPQKRRGRKKMSFAARARIAAAARWAKVKAGKVEAGPKKRRKFSAAARAKMAAAAKARWAKAKAEGKNAL